MEILQQEELPRGNITDLATGTPLRHRMLDDMAMRSMRAQT